MKRRDVLKTGAIGLGGAAAAGVGSMAVAGESVRWRMATPWPAGPLLIEAPRMLADRVSELTGGNFEIRVYQGGELVPALETLDAVQQGIAECGHGWGPYWIGRNRAFALDGGIPMGMNSRQHYAWFFNAGGMELLHELYAQFGVIGWPAGNCDYQMGGFFREEINSLDDLQGLRFRIGGLGGEILSRMGVSTEVIAGGEIFPALERGAVDAAEWVGPYDDEQLGLHEVAPYYYYPSWWEPGTPLSVYVNLEQWNALPSEYQSAFQTAAWEVNLRHMAMYDYENTHALKRLKDEGVMLREFPADIMEEAARIAEELYEEYADENEDWNRIWSHYREHQELFRESFETMAYSYSRFNYRG